ncbi:hypothetical protein [Arthrobacter sp. B2a2-09]|uniref:hypothetical protein n=1 Tax=Arthrobacter sp. B2a2-09 TaxID=2952822 RepID=UPI0022CD2CAB|nr:hypothetical protein [Arthrobacter sp. B2a2-09]MCZ9883646.1 hypothetical protein [Arthrobacter sp. B2a2-09]
MRMRFRSTTITLAFLAIMGVLNVSRIPLLWLMYTAAAGMLVGGFSVAFLVIYVAIKTKAEEETGYTTLQHGNRKLEQRDPYLGRVIRGPGEDYLQRADFREIVQSAKAEAEEAAQKSRTSRR